MHDVEPESKGLPAQPLSSARPLLSQKPLLSTRPLLWLAISGAALTVGLLVLVYGLTVIVASTADPARVRDTQLALVLYARIILIKAVWPHWLGMGALFAAIEHRTPVGRASTSQKVGVLVALGLAIAALVSVVSLPSEVAGLPRVTISGPRNFAATCIELTLASLTALLLATWAIRRLARRIF